MEVLSIVTNISRYGGAQKVMMDIHHGLKGQLSSKILSLQAFDTVHPQYFLSEADFIRFGNPLQLNNKTVLVHARNLLPFLLAMKKLFFLNTRIIYVSHSVYTTHKNLTFFPKEIVSISNKVTENLQNYFKVPIMDINLIHNGIKDCLETNEFQEPYQGDKIRILYPGRINNSKRQVQILNALRGALDKRIEIHFAGVGEDFETLLSNCWDEQFQCLGFIEDMDRLIMSYDYVMLYSLQEGLSLSLIEGLMHGKPLLMNDVGGNLEIGIPGVNAFLLNDRLDLLAFTLNGLVHVSKDEYMRLSHNSRSHYLERFQYKDMIYNYLQLLNNRA